MPTFGKDPDGDVSMDWLFDKNNILSASFSGRSMLAVAYVEGEDGGLQISGNFTERFNGRDIPPRFLETLDIMYQCFLARNKKNG